MRREIKLILLVFILVVGPAIAVSFLSARVLGSWQIVVSKRMETEANRVLDRATTDWVNHLSLVRADIGVTNRERDGVSWAVSRAAATTLSNAWIDAVFICRPGVGLVYPPTWDSAPGPDIVPPESNPPALAMPSPESRPIYQNRRSPERNLVQEWR